MDAKETGCKMIQGKLSVSIVVPVYNVSLYIERCIKSVMAQNYPVKECIIVDDASPDDSIAKCVRLIDRYDGPTRFVILHHGHNRGLSAARNSGTDNAQGDYVFYLDGDDELTPDCIEKLARPIERDSSIEIVQGNHQVLKDGVTWIGNEKLSVEEDFFSSTAVRECYYEKAILRVTAWNKLIAKRFLVDNGLSFPEGLLHEDVTWAFYVVKYLQHLYMIPDVTYHYYVRPLSISTGASYEDRAYSLSIICKDIAEHFTLGEEAREAKFYLRMYFVFFFKNRRMEGFKSALPLFEKALAGDDSRRVRVLLWMLKLSYKSTFLHCIFAIVLSVNRFLMISFRRFASLWKKVKK